MSLILSEYIEPFSACLIKSVCKIFDVKVTNTHCCSLAKNDPFCTFGKISVGGFVNHVIKKFWPKDNFNEKLIKKICFSIKI